MECYSTFKGFIFGGFDKVSISFRFFFYDDKKNKWIKISLNDFECFLFGALLFFCSFELFRWFCFIKSKTIWELYFPPKIHFMAKKTIKEVRNHTQENFGLFRYLYTCIRVYGISFNWSHELHSALLVLLIREFCLTLLQFQNNKCYFL